METELVLFLVDTVHIFTFKCMKQKKKDVLLGQSLAVGKTRQQVAQMTLR